MTSKRLIQITAMASIPFLLAGCGEGGATTNTSHSNAASEAPPAWMLTSNPGDALSVTEAKASAKEGDEIVVRALIGGDSSPISAESPVLRVVDAGLFNRCTAEADHCSTPWDYCCAAPDDLVANSATVQIVDADGTPTSAGSVAQGLEPLDEIVVIGTVGPRPDENVLTVKAHGVYRIP